MRKFTFILAILGAAFSSAAQFTVQGIPYNNPLRSAGEAVPMSGSADTSFTFDNILNWSGEGENQAAFVVQWNVAGETSARVYGYRWDGDAYGVDMVQAICANNPDLYCLIQYTGSMGYTICGIGFDADGDDEIGLVNTSDNKTYSSENGVFVHPGTAYDYDSWKAVDSDDYWAAGWYSGYWSYWISSTTPSDFTYSGVGASSRKLSNGCWDGWSFMQNMQGSAWKEFVAAPSQTPDGAVTEFYIDGIYYSLKSYNSRTVIVTAPFEVNNAVGSYSGSITIPQTITCYDPVSKSDVTYTVVGIDNSAFADSQVSAVAIPETVASIGNDAFRNSTLSDINITDNIKKIGSYAFYGCSGLKTAVIPASMTVIPEGLYGGTGITSLVLPDVITEVGAHSFENCVALETLTFDDALENIGAAAFEGCSKLSVLKFPADITAISAEAFAGCDGLTSVVVSQTKPLSITEDVFSETAYSNAKLTVPMGYTSEYASATGWSKFVNVDEVAIAVNVGDYFEAGGVAFVVTACGDGANTVSVSNYEASGTTTTLIAAANKAGYVGDVVIPATVKYQGVDFVVSDMLEKVFYGASDMTSITFNNSLSALPAYALYNCSSLTSIIFPDGLTAIGDWSMYGCKGLTTVSIPETVTSIGSRVFYGSGLVEITLPEGLTALGGYTFNSTNLVSVVIPDGIKVLEDYLFNGCKNLSSITFASDITEIGDRVFNNCSALTKFEIPATVKSIGQYAFAGTGLESITIPESVTAISSNLFNGCTKLSEVNMGGNVTSIGSYAFKGCSALGAISLPASLKTIGSYAFQNCTLLESITIPDGVTAIATYLFDGCTKLAEVNMGDNVTSIGNYAFEKCTVLKTLDLPASLKTIGNYAFRYDEALGAVAIPASVTSIGSNAFSGCKNAKIYACSATPCALNNNNSLLVSTGVYVPVYVVYGAKSAYTSQTRWKLSEVSEVVPAMTFDLEKGSIEVEAKNATISVYGCSVYGDEVPEIFIAANDEIIKPLTEITVEYRPETNSQSESESTDTDPFMYVSAIELEDGVYQVDFNDSLSPSTRYEYHWMASLDSVELGRSVTGYFTTSDWSGVDGIESDDAESDAVFYDLRGVKVDSGNLRPGVYIRVKGGEATKVLIGK